MTGKTEYRELDIWGGTRTQKTYCKEDSKANENFEEIIQANIK